MSPRARARLAFVAFVVVSGSVAPGAPAGGAARHDQGRTAHLKQWWFDALHLADAHDITTGEGVTVAVIDGFVDTSVPDLQGADVEVRPGCRGSRRQFSVTESAAADHGTAMTTALVGQGRGNGPGGRGVLGVAPGATVRFYAKQTDPDAFEECDSAEVGQLLLRAAEEGADIVSYSGGGGGAMQKYAEQVVHMGVLLVAAAGDRVDQYTSVDFPAAVPGVVAVNAVDAKSMPWSGNPFTRVEYGYPVLSAPGVDTQLGGVQGSGWKSGATRTGTSSATAIAAGMFALMKSRWPEATSNQLIQNALHHTGEDGEMRWDADYGFGVMSATNSLPVDPTRWPDRNPLLHGPRYAMKHYPTSVYGTVPSAAPSQSASAGVPRSERDPDTTEAQGESGVPMWAAVAGASTAALLLLGLGGYVRSRQPRTRDHTAQEAAHERTP